MSYKFAAIVCHLVVVLACWGIGIQYLVDGTPSPYHLEVAGAPWASLPAGVRLLISGLIRGAGAGLVALGTAQAALLIFPFRRGEFWARVALPIVGLSGLLPVLWIVFDFHARTGADTPRALVSACVVFICLGTLLSYGVAGPEGGHS